MADRTLRGSRMGAVSYETEYGAEPAPRNVAAYRCERGHEFRVPFSEEAEVPVTWDCRIDGSAGGQLDRYVHTFHFVKRPSEAANLLRRAQQMLHRGFSLKTFVQIFPKE